MQIIRVGMINSDGRTRGCQKAPIKVLEALKKINSNEKKEAFEPDALSLEEIHVDLHNIEEANYLIFENSKEAFGRNFKTFFIGGDHSMDYSILKAFNKTEKDPLLIVFDAHADCSKSGSFNRMWLRKAIEEGFNSRKVILISSRNLNKEEIDFLKRSEIAWISMAIIQENIDEICDMVMERARNSGGFYISIDIDCADPAFAPGTSDFEVGGLSSRELIYFVKRLSLLKNFRGAGISEINLDKDINGMTASLGAKVLAEMI